MATKHADKKYVFWFIPATYFHESVNDHNEEQEERGP